MLYRFCRTVLRILFFLFFRLKASGMENIPANGPVIFCANHRSTLDPPLVGTPLNRPLHFMAKEELFHIPGFSWLIRSLHAFPVKRGGVSKESIRLSIQLLKDGGALCIFPEGTRKNAGGMGKKGAAMLALRSGATVIPTAITGNYKLFRPMKISYGKPVELAEFAEGGADYLEAATDKIMRVIREMVTAADKVGKN